MSPKNKGKFGKGKSDVEVEDEFVSGVQKVTERLRPYTFPIVAAMVGIFLTAALVVTYNWFTVRKANRATALFQQALEIQSQEVVEPEPPDPEDPANPEDAVSTPDEPSDTDDADDPDEPPTHASHKDRAVATLGVLAQLRAEYGGTDAAKRACPFHGSVLLDAERWDEAAKIYRECSASAESATQNARAAEGLGYALESGALAQKDEAGRAKELEAALAAFDKMQPKDDQPLRDMALYHQARVLQRLGRKEEAIARYKQVLDVAPETSLRRTINNRIALLEESKTP